ncbi:alpha/beta hydrolase [[Eubacterium] hominis]|uniref:alpha/beta hydrolase n=1 Tax=[Eubacterium] hominis TaxID=2764325 RepID=UPI003A4E25F6
MLLLSILLIIVVIILCICIGIGLYFYHRAIDAKTEKPFISINPHKTLTEDDQWYLQNKNVKHLEMNTEDHIKLHASEIRNKGNRWVIIVHGYMGRLEDMIPQAHQFYDRGYQVLLPDLRGHGRSEGSVIGFGYLDHLDILAWCDKLKQEGAEQILLYGVSMGASTVMMCADAVSYPIEAIIEDCGFSNLKDQLTHIVKQMVPKVPSSFLIGCLSLVMKWKSGYRIKDANPSIHVQHSKVPILFLHGDRDTFISIDMMEELYTLCNNKKRKVMIPGGRHANSCKIRPQLYWESIDSFLVDIRQNL